MNKNLKVHTFGTSVFAEVEAEPGYRKKPGDYRGARYD